ncbi:hypothetical protein Hte_009067 [Hypoxylon texense]
MNRVKAAAAACLLASSALTSAEAFPPGPPGPAGPHGGAPPPKGPHPSDVRGLTDIPYDALLLSVVPAGHHSRPHRRDGVGEFDLPQGIQHPPPQPGNSFIGDDGFANAADCSEAAHFTLSKGRLSRNGHFLTADPDFVYVPFARPLPTDAVAHTFSVVDGYLRWSNDRFFDGHAGFCQVPYGQVYATFHNENTWPFNCEPVDIWVDLAGWCRDRQIAHDGEGHGADFTSHLGYPVGEHEQPHHGNVARTDEHHKDHDDKDHDKDHKKKHHDKDHKKDHKKDHDKDHKKKKHHDKDHKKDHDKDHKKDHDKGHKKEHKTKPHEPTHHSYPTHSTYHHSSSYPTHSSSYHSSYPTHTSSSYYHSSSSYYSKVPHTSSSYSAVPYSSETPVPYATKGGEYPTEKHVYPMDASPTDADCAPTPMSWHVGYANPTFLKDEL